jgi:DNA-directed RNA polymerase subunit RPC12/RpoP
MNVTYSCPHCQQAVRSDVDAHQPSLECPSCRHRTAVPANSLDSTTLHRCLVCPSTDLFIRKDFPQRLGVGIVVLGIVASSVTWGLMFPIATFAILFATALVDVALYLVVPDALMCYRCGSQYRSVSGLGHQAFNLETHERYRQQAARMAGR